MTKTLTIRLPVDLYKETHEIARERKMSVNALVQESLRALVEDEKDKTLYQAFSDVGQDYEESRVDFATQAQWEVIAGDD